MTQVRIFGLRGRIFPQTFIISVQHEPADLPAASPAAAAAPSQLGAAGAQHHRERTQLPRVDGALPVGDRKRERHGERRRQVVVQAEVLCVVVVGDAERDVGSSHGRHAIGGGAAHHDHSKLAKVVPHRIKKISDIEFFLPSKKTFSRHFFQIFLPLINSIFILSKRLMIHF